MAPSPKRDLQRRAFIYLDKHLSIEIKKQVPSTVLKEILRCLSEWVIEGQSKRIETRCNEFYDEVEKSLKQFEK